MLFLLQSHSDDGTIYSIFLQNAETVALVGPSEGNDFIFAVSYKFELFWCDSLIVNLFSGNAPSKTVVPVTSLKVGDEVLLRVQGGARHTGIEIQEFIVEN